MKRNRLIEVPTTYEAVPISVIRRKTEIKPSVKKQITRYQQMEIRNIQSPQLRKQTTIQVSPLSRFDSDCSSDK